MESTIGACKSGTNDDNSSESSPVESSAAKSCDESVNSQTIYSEHFDEFKDESTDFTANASHESIQSKDEYITLRKRTDGQVERIVKQVNNSNIVNLKTEFDKIITKYKKDRDSKNITLTELEEDYSKVFGNVGIIFYKYKEDKSNLHNAFFPTLLGKEVNLDDPTFERIYKKQMVLDLCLFVYNLNLFETIHKPYTYITYNFVAIDNRTKRESADFSIASTKSNRDAIKIVKGCKQICKSAESNPVGTEVCTTGQDYDCSQLTTGSEYSDSGRDSDSELGGGKKSKSNQCGKKGLKKNHKTNKKRSNRSFMVKGKKTKPRKTQRKKNKKKKTQRKKFAVKKDIKKKTKRVRFNL